MSVYVHEGENNDVSAPFKENRNEKWYNVECVNTMAYDQLNWEEFGPFCLRPSQYQPPPAIPFSSLVDFGESRRTFHLPKVKVDF